MANLDAPYRRVFPFFSTLSLQMWLILEHSNDIMWLTVLRFLPGHYSRWSRRIRWCRSSVGCVRRVLAAA